MAETTQTTATAPAPTAGTPAPVGSSTAATAATTTPMPTSAVDAFDLSAALRADLAGPAMTATEQEQQGTPLDEEAADPLQAELEDEPSAPDTPTDEEAAPESEQETETEDPADPDKDATDDDGETVPKGMENWPKQAVKRIQKQSEAIRALKQQVAQGAIQVSPTEASPLADVTTTEALDQRLQMAKGIRNWCREHPHGGSIELANGGSYEITPEIAQAKLAKAEREIEAYSDRKLYLAEREQAKPWEAAEAVAPGILQSGTQENAFLTNVLKAVPQLATTLPDYELFVACAARGMRQLVEEQKGQAKYVRYELKDGKIVSPKTSAAGTTKASSSAQAGKQGAHQAQPFRPTNQRPPVRAAGASEGGNLASLEARAASGDEVARRQLLRAELAA